MQLQMATWPEVEAYLERSRGIILPIGSTEQHGPTGLIGTDALTFCPPLVTTDEQIDRIVDALAAAIDEG